MKLSFTFFSLMLSISLWSQTSSFSYNNDEEKKLFQKIEQGETFSLENISFCLTPVQSTANHTTDQIASTRQQLKAKKLDSKSVKKQLKEIQKILNTNFLKTFNIESSFQQLFQNKQFNSLTAASLFSIFLDDYNIPYTIHQGENGFIYLITFDNGSKTILKPKKLPSGNIEYNQEYKQNYITYLVQNKVISQEEKDISNVNQLFLTHYTAESIISKSQLASLFYYQKANTLSNLNKHKEALVFAEKATYLNPDYKINFLYYSLLAITINQEIDNNNYDGTLIGKFLNLVPESNNERKSIANTILVAANEFLVKTQNLEKFETFFKEFKDSTNDEVEFDEFQSTYHESLANYYYLNRDYEKAINHLSESLIINPNNLQVKRNIENCFNNIMALETDSHKAIQKHETYFEIFPFLKENKINQLNYTGSYLRAIYQTYLSKDLEKGYQTILDFEKLMKTSPELKFDQGYVDSAFILAANSYQAKDSKKMSDILNIGLKIAPKSSAILQSYNQIKQYRNYRKQMETERNEAFTPEQSFTEKVNEYLKKCWTVTKMEKLGDDTEKNDDLEFTIELSGYKKLSYKSDKKTFEGDYSVRYESKLLYLIPNNNRSKYIIYQIMDIDANELVLRPFVNGKLGNRILTLSTCK